MKARGLIIFFKCIFKSQVFTLLVEEPTRYLVLIRFYEDFEEFDKRVKSKLIYKKTSKLMSLACLD